MTINILKQSAKFALRDWKAGELKVLFMALLITVATSTSISYFSARLQMSMSMKADEFLAADSVLQSTSVIEKNYIKKAEKFNLTTSQSTLFSTVIVGDEDIQLVSVRAVDENYPLRGSLRVKDTTNTEERIIRTGPQRGEIWAEQRLLLTLNLNVGDKISIGNTDFTLSKILTYAPDRAGGFYTFNPFVLMNREDVEATGVVQAGSRESYRLLLAGDPISIEKFNNEITPLLKPNQKILTNKDGNAQVGHALARAENYLNLASLVGVLLASVAIALSANQFARKRFNDSALLRCLGLSKLQMLLLYVGELVIIGFISSILAVFLGWIIQNGLFFLLKEVINAGLPSGGISPVITGFLMGFIVLVGFGIPPLIALSDTPPVRVLRQNIEPKPLKSIVIYAISLCALGIIMWRLSLNLTLTLIVLVGIVVVLLTLGGLFFMVLTSLRTIFKNAPFIWRIALGQVFHAPLKTVGQMVAFSIILMTMAIIVLLRGELLNNWQSQLPKNSPNYFALNVTPDLVSEFQKDLRKLSPNVSEFYPIITGRLTEINGKEINVNQFKDSGRGENALERDLNLTWTSKFPESNKITFGEWWENKNITDQIEISIEDKLAASLGVSLDDRLTFVIEGKAYKTKIKSLRKVNWESIQPNFFVIFSPNSLNNIPTTYLSSFYLPEGSDLKLIELLKKYPTITVLDLKAVLEQLNMILSQVTLAVEYILVFVLIAGIIVLVAGLQATLSERLREGAILRVLGANRSMMLRSRYIEFGIIGALSGGFAMIGSEIISFVLYRVLLDLPWAPHLWLLLLPIIGVVIIALIGIIGTRKVISATPLTILRENN